MISCCRCGSSERLRYDRAAGAFVCVEACGAKPAPRRRTRRTPLFYGFVVEDGTRRRASRSELAEAYRLWSVHADLRDGLHA